MFGFSFVLRKIEGSLKRQTTVSGENKLRITTQREGFHSTANVPKHPEFFASSLEASAWLMGRILGEVC